MMNCFRRIFYAFGLLLLTVGWSSCKKFVQVEPPNTSVNEGNVYQSDATAIGAVTGIYSNIINQGRFSGKVGISFLSGLSADELTLSNTVTDNSLIAYYRNQLRTSSSENYGTEFWGGAGANLYYYIFCCNGAIEGLNKSGSLTPAVKSQLMGEVKFLRAFNYFYLTALYGDVVLSVTTDPNINVSLPRSSQQLVYEQIVEDLKESRNLLNSSFLDATLLKSSSERVRLTKWAASALLARTYLYINQYANAEAEASKVIANTTQFSLSPINSVFLKNSSEAIWQLQPVQTGRNTEDAMTLVLPLTGPNSNANPVYLSPQQLAAFENGDWRRKPGGWVDSVIAGGTNYYYSAKYKATTISGGTFTEYLMIFRLGEQYLIRAEARAMLNNFQGAKDDLNMIRTRAGLQDTNANDQASLLTAILRERQVELFTEMGHRWLDLKRTGTVDEVMTVVTPLKANGTTWKSYQQLYPIPFPDIQMNPNLIQNSGYQ